MPISLTGKPEPLGLEADVDLQLETMLQDNNDNNGDNEKNGDDADTLIFILIATAYYVLGTVLSTFLLPHNSGSLPS